MPPHPLLPVPVAPGQSEVGDRAGDKSKVSHGGVEKRSDSRHRGYGGVWGVVTGKRQTDMDLTTQG